MNVFLSDTGKIIFGAEDCPNGKCRGCGMQNSVCTWFCCDPGNVHDACTKDSDC